MVKFDLGRFKFGDTVIRAQEFNVTDKITVESYKPSDSKNNYDSQTTEHEITFELKGVHPEFYEFFNKVVIAQDKGNYNPPDASTYNYDVDGNLEHTTTLIGCWIEELPEETVNKPFDISGKAHRKEIAQN